MKKAFLFLLILTACSTGKFLNKSGFETITVGSDIQIIESQYGEPYDVQNFPNGMKEYRYIERIEIAPGVTEHLHYILIVAPNGKVIRKRVDAINNSSSIRVQ